jgi:hypothetical protein
MIDPGHAPGNSGSLIIFAVKKMTKIYHSS